MELALNTPIYKTTYYLLLKIILRLLGQGYRFAREDESHVTAVLLLANKFLQCMKEGRYYLKLNTVETGNNHLIEMANLAYLQSFDG